MVGQRPAAGPLRRPRSGQRRAPPSRPAGPTLAGPGCGAAPLCDSVGARADAPGPPPPPPPRSGQRTARVTTANSPPLPAPPGRACSCVSRAADYAPVVSIHSAAVSESLRRRESLGPTDTYEQWKRRLPWLRARPKAERVFAE